MSRKSLEDAYGVLPRHSEALRNQREPNIDDLLTIVTESVEAYKVCTSRIDAVEQALEKSLERHGSRGAFCRLTHAGSPATESEAARATTREYEGLPPPHPACIGHHSSVPRLAADSPTSRSPRS